MKQEKQLYLLILIVLEPIISDNYWKIFPVIYLFFFQVDKIILSSKLFTTYSDHQMTEIECFVKGRQKLQASYQQILNLWTMTCVNLLVFWQIQATAKTSSAIRDFLASTTVENTIQQAKLASYQVILSVLKYRNANVLQLNITRDP